MFGWLVHHIFSIPFYVTMEQDRKFCPKTLSVFLYKDQKLLNLLKFLDATDIQKKVYKKKITT